MDGIVNEKYPSHLFSENFRRKYRETILLQADVILSTLNSVQNACLKLEQLKHKEAFRCLIVDEATQCTEPELLKPLIHSVNKLILIGDHRQLPATVISNISQRAGFERSMFERLNSCNMSIVKLYQQFRMQKEICNFPSRNFYNGKLKTHSNIGVNSKIPLMSYFLFDVSEATEKKVKIILEPEISVPEPNVQANISLYNLEEINFIIKLLLVIFNRLGYNVNEKSLGNLPKKKLKVSIGVITFYRGQKQELEKKLRELHFDALLKHVDINTVDSFQGQERDIVILSCVRALANGKVGFVRSEKRMNVALTRAKSALYICINGGSFLGVPYWQRLLNDAKKRDLFCSIASQISWEKLQNTLKKKDTKQQTPSTISTSKRIKRPRKRINGSVVTSSHILWDQISSTFINI